MEENKPINSLADAKPPNNEPQLNNASTDEPIVPAADTTTEAEQPSTLNPQPSTVEDMEVHHHTHHEQSKRNWKSYFWEFLMLFLAVFCGFLAEYQLEHTIENGREKQFMSSLVEDLDMDTIELLKAIKIADTVARYSDSTLIFLSSNKIIKHTPIRLATLVGKAGQRQNLINTDRTSSQLKNSGAMRLIRNKNVSNLILHYWKKIEESNISLDRYMLYRDASRSLVFKLWLIPEIYRTGYFMTLDSIKQLRVIDNDQKKWDELSNLIAMCGNISENVHHKNLNNQLLIAKELITLIKKEYNLK